MALVENHALPVTLKPIGVVESSMKSTGAIPYTGNWAKVRVFPAYLPAMHRMTEHSHFWILCWFHEADRSLLRKIPGVNPHLPEYGVFGLRAAQRPNPIGLTLVDLEKVEGDMLYVSGLDAVDGTPVLDIKPYFESDIVFSPKTPHIRTAKYHLRERDFHKQALAHHGEECLGLELGVQMALIIDTCFGKIQAPDLQVTVTGDPCLADVLQGLTRARLANPARFCYRESTGAATVTWRKDDKAVKFRVRPGVDLTAAREAADDLFDFEVL
ncbi:MAG TPA: tRNA (N6-threonylcarbamoyladenosine(37)-N6)-methyltransferase TrmO [Negativicutes bacterium]|nr:tRNA (N6-threonylcarbamoyladenosine(37)-N6)-methyltransferase TrmO [Negativicutes bacterium]